MLLPPYERRLLPTQDGTAQIPCLFIGRGSTPIVVLPGAGDGRTIVTDAGLRLAWFFRERDTRYRLLALSRRHPFPAGFNVEQQAEDALWALERLGWRQAVVECNSAGGPIGQWMAVKRPEAVSRLILSSTFHRTGDQTRELLRHWIDLARRQRWAELSWSSIEHTYRPRTVALIRPFRWLLPFLSRPKWPERLPRMLEVLLNLDNRQILPRIACPTLVVGGEDDRIFPVAIQREMAALIPDCKFQLCARYGHGNDQENPEYRRLVDRFVAETTPPR